MINTNKVMHGSCKVNITSRANVNSWKLVQKRIEENFRTVEVPEIENNLSTENRIIYWVVIEQLWLLKEK